MGRSGILFVDDDANILNGMRRMLHARRDWNLMFANDAAQALDMLATNDVEVVVTDIDMPGMTGEQLIWRLHQGFPTVMPIVLSGAWTSDIALSQLGPHIQFLSKPVPANVLQEALETAIGWARLSAF